MRTVSSEWEISDCWVVCTDSHSIWRRCSQLVLGIPSRPGGSSESPQKSILVLIDKDLWKRIPSCPNQRQNYSEFFLKKQMVTVAFARNRTQWRSPKRFGPRIYASLIHGKYTTECTIWKLAGSPSHSSPLFIRTSMTFRIVQWTFRKSECRQKCFAHAEGFSSPSIIGIISNAGTGTGFTWARSTSSSYSALSSLIQKTPRSRNCRGIPGK